MQALFSRFATVLWLLPPALNAAQVSRCPRGNNGASHQPGDGAAAVTAVGAGGEDPQGDGQREER